MKKINKYIFFIFIIASINFSFAADNNKWLNFNKKGPPIKTVSITQARKPIYKTSVNLYEKYKDYLEIFNKIEDLEKNK